MSTPAPSLEGKPLPAAVPHPAPPGPVRPAVGGPKDVAEGAPIALRPNRYRSNQARHRTPDPTPERPGIRIYAPPVYRHHEDGARWSTRHGDTPTAAYACTCGQTGTAIGAHAVAALVADYDAHRSVCTGVPVPLAEGRDAA
ncbi:hypothetical protein [Streptomyces sp. NPDC008150]|uniref:hypothetical protein n=1 Tax=Streptomyces sp. NPDC008150 TaxID=3364816 RepID=UPI0036E4E41F